MSSQIPPPTSWSQPQKPPIGGNPIALRQETFARFDRAVRYVELMTRELPFTPHRGRTTGTSSGVWGLLKPGATVSGAGILDVSTDDPPVYTMTLGTGKMEICFRDPNDPATLKAIPGNDENADSKLVTVYNSGPGFTAGSDGAIYPMLWMDGHWFPLQLQPGAGFLAIATGNIPARIGSQFGIGKVTQVIVKSCVLCSSSSSSSLSGASESSSSSQSSCSSGSGTGACQPNPNCTMETVQGTASGPTYCVFNPSSTKMTSGNGIDDGMYCWTFNDSLSGLLCVAPLECS